MVIKGKIINPPAPPFFKGGLGGFCFLFLFFFAILVPSDLLASKQLNENLTRLRSHKGPYSFVVIGDNRVGDKIYQTLIGLALKRGPYFFVNTGDQIVTPGEPGDWDHFFKISEQIKAPYFLAAGNHSIEDEKSEAVWKEKMDLPGNELYYSWTVGRSLFVVLDTQIPGREFRIEGVQLDWLKRTLDPVKYDHQFVFLHAPLFLNRDARHYGESLDKYPKLRDELEDLFEQRKVTAVFSGHEHKYEKRNVDGVWYIISGGGGQRLYGMTFCHFVLVSVDGRRVEVKVVDKEGVLQDEFFVHPPLDK